MNSIPPSGSLHNSHPMRVGEAFNAAACASAENANGARLILQIPLHRLGAQSSTIAANAATPPVIQGGAENRDALDQRATHRADELMHLATDADIDVLALTGSEARSVLSRPNALPALRELRLTNCTDADLIDLAAMLKTVPHKPFALSFGRNKHVFISEQGLAALGKVTFSSITLGGTSVYGNAARGLLNSASAVSILLPQARQHGETALASYLRIPTLTALDARPRSCPHDIGLAIASHQSLKEFSIGDIDDSTLGEIATSTTIQSLSCGRIMGLEEVAALGSFADNTILQSLRIACVAQPYALSALSRNKSLRFVSLGVSPDVRADFSALANMSAVEMLSLRCVSAYNLRLQAKDVHALCERPFKSLSLHNWDIHPAAQMLIAAAPLRHLLLNGPTPFSDAANYALSLNPTITSLSVGRATTTAANAIILARSPTLQYFHAGFLTHFSADEKAAITNAWHAAGKPLANLELNQRFPLSVDR